MTQHNLILWARQHDWFNRVEGTKLIVDDRDNHGNVTKKAFDLQDKKTRKALYNWAGY